MRHRMTAGGLLLVLSLLVPFLGCFERTGNRENQEEVILAAGIYQILQPQITIAGNWDFYDGPGGTTKSGTFFISASLITQAYSGFDPVSARIVEFDNDRGILYGQNTADHPYEPNQFTWYKWTSSGGKFYICPDLTGYHDTLEDAKAEDYTLSADESDLNTGCSGWFWSRLEIPSS